jgi:hypothetical protein
VVRLTDILTGGNEQKTKPKKIKGLPSAAPDFSSLQPTNLE